MNRPLSGGPDKRHALAGAAAVALAIGLAACGGGGSGDGPGPQPLDLTIGNLLPLSGPSRSLGTSGSQASQLALREIERTLGAPGGSQSVEISNADQGGEAASAADAARHLVDSLGATCLTGPWTPDGVAQVAEEVAVPKEVLEISPVATGDAVAALSDHDLVDSTALPVSTEGEAIARAIEQSVGGIEGHTVNVAAGTDPSATTASQDFMQAWQEGKGTIGEQVALTPGTSTAPQLTANAPQAVLLADTPAAFAQLAPGLASGGGWNPAIAWGNDQLVSPGLPKQAGSQTVEGMRALAPGMPSADQATSAFVSAFESAAPRGVRIAPFAAQEFDATILCYLAAVAAGSTDGRRMADELIDITAPGGTKYSWQQLPAAIRALEDGRDIDYTGASGPIDMGVNGNATDGVFGIYRYSSGRLEAAGEIPVSQPNPATP